MRGQFTFIGVFPRFTVAANFFRADPGAKRRKRNLLQKQSFFLFLFLFLFIFLFIVLFIFLLIFLFLSLSLSFSSALSSSLSFSNYTFDKRQPNHHAEPHALQVLQVLQISQVHRQKIDINCRQVKSLLNVRRIGSYFFWGTVFWNSTLKRVNIKSQGLQSTCFGQTRAGMFARGKWVIACCTFGWK